MDCSSVFEGGHSPNPREEATEEESAITLDERREEGEDTIDRERDEQTLSPTQPISQAAPEEGSHHHAQVHNEACGEEETGGPP